jgi:predicted DNA-binding WGR domain protein
MERPQVISATTVWNNSGNSDKVYSLQLVENSDKTFSVHAQWGKREKATSSQIKADHVSRWKAESVYNTFLSTKVNKRGYTRTITPAIIPTEFGGLGSTTVTKEEQLKLSEMVKGLEEFLAPVENPDTTSAMDTLFAMYENN